MKNTQDLPQKRYDEMTEEELRQNGISEVNTIFEMAGAKKDDNKNLYLFWEKVYKTLKRI